MKTHSAALIAFTLFCSACQAALSPQPAAAAAPAPRSTSLASMNGDVQSWLTSHNARRAKLRAKPLGWSQKLSDYAQQFARQIAAQGDEWPEHSTGPYGENLYFLTSDELPSPQGTVDAWASEREGYDHKTGRCEGGWVNCGHYTQLIWPTTTQVGCAAAESKGSRHWYVVCEYDPPGNAGLQ